MFAPHQDYAVSSTLSFETNGITTPPKILHQIASGIQGEGLKVKRISILRQPYTAHIYIKDMQSEPKKKLRLISALASDKDAVDYDYVVCLSVRVFPLFKQTCSYSIERRSYYQTHKASAKQRYCSGVSHIRQCVSESILECFKMTGAKILASPNLSIDEDYMLA